MINLFNGNIENGTIAIKHHRQRNKKKQIHTTHSQTLSEQNCLIENNIMKEKTHNNNNVINADIQRLI